MGSANPASDLSAENRGTTRISSVPPLFEHLSVIPPVVHQVSDYDRRYRLSLTSHCHGEMKFSIYPEPTPKKRRQHQGVSRCGAMAPRPTGIGNTRQGYWTDARCEEARLQRKAQAPNLDSSSEFQDRVKSISGWGELPPRKIFRRYGRTVINECGEIAWRKYGKRGCFLTGTIPGSGDAIAQTVAKYSGWLMNRVKQWFRDCFTAEYSVFAVWELQKRGMLHIHVCVTSTQTGILTKLLNTWHSRWNALLLELSNKTACDLFRKNESVTWRDRLDKTQHDAQWLRQNPSRYLSKYLSKGSRKLATGAAYHPSRWWSVDRKTAAQARAERLRVLAGGVDLNTLTQTVSAWFEASKESFAKVFQFQNPKEPRCGGVVAFIDATMCGAMVDWFYEHVRSELQPDMLISC